MTLAIPGYSLLEEIHRGHNAVLHRARRDADGAPVIVKTPRSQSPSARELASIWHEHAVLREIEVPGVIRAHALVQYGDALALVLEGFERGLPLAARLREGPLPLEAALRIGAALAGILDSVHDRGVIHKDICPANVLVRPETREIRLLGFKTATRLPQETQRFVGPEALEGTILYMAPEQTGRMNRVIDRRSDLYALGVTLYEMLTGALPFAAGTPMEIIHGHIARTPLAPHERAPGVPEMVSRLVMRLLAKNAEDRYQSARGLKVDLERCLGELGATGDIRPFALGLHDRSDTLRLPQKLYGRAAEEQALGLAFRRAATGRAELVLIAGYPGIGKSALVHEIHKAIARRGGYFAVGKYDQLGRTVPYASLTQAFRELCRQILGEPKERLDRWRRRIDAALGTGGQVLVDLMPELGWIIGPQPPVPALGPAESQNRFHLLFKGFAQALAAAEHPLVLFLDDLQWVDAASLKLLTVLLADPGGARLLLIGAYRDNEVDAAHPLARALGELRRAGAALTEIELGPLDISEVARLLSDALGIDRERVEPLARSVTARTAGNPFFLRQLLAALHAEGLLCFDADLGAWTWDQAAIEARPAEGDVVDFLAGKIARLSPESQGVLKLAACIGHQFDLRTLAVIHERPAAETAAALWEALQAGLIVPVDADYRLVHSASVGGPPGLEAGALPIRYRFLHDRVQQAAYAQIIEGRQEVHLRIGRLMLASLAGDPRAEALFDVANHLNIGAALIDDPAERVELSALNLAAGRKARAATAHVAALGSFRVGMELLPEDAWESRYDLALALHRERAEAEYLNGHFEEADQLYDAALSRARTAMDKVGVHVVQVTQYQLQARYADALRVLRAALSLLGWAIPEAPHEVQAMLEREMAAADAHTRALRIEDLLGAPRMTCPVHLATLQILQIMLYAAYMSGDHALANLAMTKMATLSMEHGNGELSPFGYIGYAMVLETTRGDYGSAYRFGRMAIDLSEQFENAAFKCKANFLFASDVHSWVKPIRDADPYYDRAYALGLESGDWVTTGYVISQSASDRLTRGMPLAELSAILKEQLAFLERARSQDVIDFVRAGVVQPLRNLQGLTDSAHTFDGQGFTEAGYLAQYGHLPYYEAWLYYAKIRSAYLFDDRARWPELVGKLAVIEAAVPTHTKVPEATFYAALMLLSSFPEEGPAREAHRARLAQLEARLCRLAEHGPANVLHKHRLVLAEQARVEGNRLTAMDLYEEAMELSRRHGHINTEALASERYALFWLDQGKIEIARTFMRKARGLYEAWGARGKVAYLWEKHAALLAEEAPPEPTASAESPAEVGQGGALDLFAALQAGQALVGERELNGVLGRLMSLLLSNAGATCGFLLLVRDDALVLDARMEVDPDRVEVGVGARLEERDDLAHAVVHYVARTRESVVLGSAAADPRFAGDPYIASGKARSLLCLALSHQQRLSGVLYLENRLAEDAFSRDRIHVLELLSTQAAIAVENALLYEHLRQATAKLREANDRLEAEVAARTEELRLMNERLVEELKERERAEAARAALHEEIIRLQEQQLQELSTPLIPISEDVVVMPLVGSMDARRATQVLETALHGARARAARAVILDVTGMKQADAAAASALVQAASALHLLGAETVLTGVRPDMARQLVEIGVNLGHFVIRGTLQAGIAYASAPARAAGRRPGR